ncbi:MAG: type I restriction-modification system subunit M [Bacteroidota bacterium]|nr:type I restriction-modification system subunit M [Bacteroidota bacterium]
MATKKSEIYSSLWDACNKLRGGMEPLQYKDYVLKLLFLKYISDKKKSGAEMLITIPDGCSFDDIIAIRGKSNIGEEINKILQKLSENNTGYEKVFNSSNVDFNDETKFGKQETMRKTLSDLIACFQKPELDFSQNNAADDDLIGDAYEFLMRKFASESGKSKGQFFTPTEVSTLMALLIDINKDTRNSISIYDPTCGSGSLLLRAKAQAKANNVSIDGQEFVADTVSLAWMNMIIHGVSTPNIKQGDTILDPQFKNDDQLNTYNYVVSNPPFSQAFKGQQDVSDKYGRWTVENGIPPASCEDYAFLLHVIKSIDNDGKGAIILPHGVLFRGNAEGRIREYIITQKYIKGIVGLPQNLFYGTGIPACIIIIDKHNRHTREGIFFIDAKNGYKKDGAKNRLRSQDIKLISDVWNEKKDIPHFSRMVSYKEIEDNNFNLNISRYIEPKDTEIQQDIYAHLHGGIPKQDVEDNLKHFWQICLTLKDKLFALKDNNNYYEMLIVNKQDITQTIQEDESYKEQNLSFNSLIDNWQKATKELLLLHDKQKDVEAIIHTIGENIIQTLKGKDLLVDEYDIYEKLCDYWDETMRDDCYMIKNSGWTFEVSKTSKTKTTKVKDIACDLLPVNVLCSTFFNTEKQELDNLYFDLEDLNSQINEIKQDNEDVFYNEEKNKSYTDAQIKKLAKTTDNSIIKEFVKLLDVKDKQNKLIKEKEKKLVENIFDKYNYLQQHTDELKDVVIDNKWLKEITSSFTDIVQKQEQNLTNEISSLYKRYDQTLSQAEQEVSLYENKVISHLKEMGFEI